MKRFLKLLSQAFVFAALVSACNMTVDPLKENSSFENSNECRIIFNLVNAAENVSSRTALPQSTDWTGFTYELWAKKDGAATEPASPIISKGDFTSISTGKRIEKGKYSFTLKAYKNIGSESKVVLEGKLSDYTLSNDTETLKFIMYPSENLTGSAEITVNYPKDDIAKKVYGKVVSSITSLAFDKTTSTELTTSALNENTNTAIFTASNLDSGKIQYALFWLLDSEGSVITTIIESIQVVGGMTSKSTVTVTKAFYHRKDVSITINKAGTPSTPWYGTDTKIILKDTSSTPAKEYVLEAEKTGDPLTPTGNYTGNIPDGDYEIIIQNNGRRTETDYRYETETGTVYDKDDTGTPKTPVDVTLVTVPVPTSGISVTPVDGTDDNNNPTSSVTATEPNGDLLVPAGKDFQVEVEVEPGYEIPPEGITIGGNENVKDGDVITVTPGGTPINNPTGVTATVYSIVYKKVNDSDSTTETPTEISTWTSSTGVVTTFTVETAKVTLPTKTNIAHSTDNTKELLGWKLGSNTVIELDSALIKKIINGEIAAPNKKLDLVTVWQTKGAVSYEVWKYVEKTDSTDSTNISNFTKTTQITSGSATEGSSATYTPIAADAETGFTITVIPVTSLSSASGADNIVKVKYIRNQVTLTFKLQNTTDGKWSDNTTENKTIVGKYGATVSGVPSVTPNTNYGSDGWDVTPPETFPAENKTYTAKWKQEKANYTAQTWFEKVGSADHTSLDSDHYEKNASYTDTTYSANLNTQVMAPTIYPVPAGFELYSAPMVTLNSDGSTVVGTYYKRKDITLTFALADTTGGKWNDGTEGTKTVSGNYGASVTGVPSPTPNTHYAFAGWTSGGVAVSSLPTTFTESKTYTANWSQTGANYTVKYWFEDVDSADPANASNYAQDQSRDNAAYKDKTLSGTVGNSVTDTSPVAAPTGFTQRTITPVTLLANGTTVVNVYYQRKDITLTFTLQNTTGGKWSDNTTANKTISGNYGATVTGIPGVTANAHYASDGWDATPPGTFPAENKTYTAKWKQTEGKYTVKTYKQKSTAAYGAFATTFANFDASNYDLTDTQEKWGTIGGTTNESTAAVTGFTAARYNQCSITTDGNAVVTVWYDRNDVTLSLLNGDYGNWASSKTIQGKYGANVTNSYGNPGSSDSHFAFDAWSPVIPSTVPAGDASYTAQWKRIKADYTIKYWFEKEGSTDASAYGTNYEQNTASYANVQKTAAYPGTASGEQLTSVPTGFTHAKTDTGITLAETGTVVNVYYKRKTVTLTFKITDTTGGTWNNGSNWTVSGKYGSAVSYENMPAAQLVNSYFEVSWTPAKPEKFPTTDTTYTLTWIDNTPTTGEVSITITGAGDISVVNDSTNNRLTAQAPSGISLTYVWYNITSGTPVQAGTGANFSYASLSAGKYTFLLEGTKTDNTSIKYTTTFELVKQ